MRCTELQTIIISLRNHCAPMPSAKGLAIEMALSTTIFRQFNEARVHLSYPYFTAFNPQQVQTENLARRHRIDEAQ